jgi:hypothetical protein
MTKQKNSGRSSRRYFWASHLKNWGDSGLIQKEYCIQNNLKRETFSWWKRRLKEKNHSSQSPFIEVPVSPWNRSTSPLELIICDKFCLRINSRFNPEILREVIRVIEGL